MPGPRLALSIGCPSGVGPEVSVVAASKAKARVLLIGDINVVRRAAQLRGISPKRFTRVLSTDDPFTFSERKIGIFQPTAPLSVKEAEFGKPSRAGGAAQLAWIDAACDMTRDGDANALVTGPVSKEAIVRSNAPGSKGFIGHTEHLQKRLHGKEVVMAFYDKRFSTALVTTHMALAKVPRAITIEGVERATYFLGDLLYKLSENKIVRIAVAGLNPHAGEHGLFGREEIELISPAIALVRKRFKKEKRNIEIAGPVPAETAFRLAANGNYDGVVAMYHDQATIPMKVASFGDAVNVSLALPIIRTSVDHGTAYDIAGKGTADPSGMRAAIDLAIRLAEERATRFSVPPRYRVRK